MSTKRVKVREMKRKRTQKRVMLAIGGVILVLLIAAGAAWYGIDRYEKSYVMTFDGEKISVNDFKYLALYTSGSGEEKAEARNLLVNNLILNKVAKQDGLELTAEEMAERLTAAADLKKSASIDLGFISTQRMAELDMEGLGLVSGRLRDKYTADYTMDEAEFQAALAEYKTNSRADYTDIQMLYLITDNEDTINEAQQALEDGMDFEEAIRQYSSEYMPPAPVVDGEDLDVEAVEDEDTAVPAAEDENTDAEAVEDEDAEAPAVEEEDAEAAEDEAADAPAVEDEGEEIVEDEAAEAPAVEEEDAAEAEDADAPAVEDEDGESFPTIRLNTNMGLPEADFDLLLDLPAGEFSQIVDLGDGMYVIFYIDSVTIPTDDEIEETYRGTFETDQRNQIFSDLFDEWEKASSIEMNEKAYNAYKPWQQ